MRAAARRTGQPGWLWIAGRVVSVEAVLATPVTRARWLGRVHERRDPVRCLCVPGGIPLGVKYYEPYGTYALYPLKRHDPGRHAPACPLGFVPGSRAGLTVTLSGAACVTEREGRYEVQPGWPLRHAPPRERAAAGASLPTPSAPRVRRQRSAGASLQTLLEVLWRLAALHYWQPDFDGKRGYETVAARLFQAAERVTLRGEPLASWLYLPPVYQPSRQEALRCARERWLAKLRPDADGAFMYGYLLGQWRETVSGPEDGLVSLRVRHAPLDARMPVEQWRESLRRWRLVGSVASDELWRPSWPVWWLALVRVERAQVHVCELAALSLTDERSWLPCESEPERRVLRRLVEERRMFVKPLQAGGLGLAPDELLPDVVLLDRRDRCVLEVLGRLSDPEYAARWREKAARYLQDGRPCWVWDPERQPKMPALPPPDRRMGSNGEGAASDDRTAGQGACG